MDGSSIDARAAAGATVAAEPRPAVLTTLGARIAAIGALFALAIVHTWPLAPSMTTHVAGGEFEDTWVNIWQLEWWRATFLQGKSPFFAPDLRWPMGAELYWHTHAPAKSILGALLVPSLGTVGAYNAVILSTFFFTAITAYALCLDRLRRAGARGWRAEAGAVVGASVLDFSRYHLCHALGHMNLAAIEALPLFLLFFFRVLEEPRLRRRDVIGAALAAGYATLCDFYYVYYLALFAVGWLVLRAWREGPLVSRAWLTSADARRAAILAGAVAIACLPGVLPLLSHLKPAALEIHHNDSDYPADLSMPFVPDARSIWQRALPDAVARTLFHMQDCMLNDQEGGTFIGFVAIALAVVAFRARRDAMRPFATLALAFGVLSLGPYLFVGGAKELPAALALLAVGLVFASARVRAWRHARDLALVWAAATIVALVWGITAYNEPATFTVPLPYLFFKHLAPLFGRGGMPVRFLLLTQICVALMAAFGAYALLDRRRGSARPAWAAPAFAAVMLFAVNAETKSIPPPLTRAVGVLPPIFDQIRDDPEKVAVYTDHVFGQWEQLEHHRPVSFVRQSRLPVREKAFVDSPLHRALVRFEGIEPGDADEATATAMRAFLRANGYRYVVTHTAAAELVHWRLHRPTAELTRVRRAFIEQTLGARLVHEDAERDVFVMW